MSPDEAAAAAAAGGTAAGTAEGAAEGFLFLPNPNISSSSFFLVSSEGFPSGVGAPKGGVP